MKIPTQIKAIGYDYGVRYDKLFADAMNIWGHTSHQNQEITLEPGMTPDREAETFLHELMHVAFDMSELDERLKSGHITEEEIVSALSRALYGLIVENNLDFRRDG